MKTVATFAGIFLALQITVGVVVGVAAGVHFCSKHVCNFASSDNLKQQGE